MPRTFALIILIVGLARPAYTEAQAPTPAPVPPITPIVTFAVPPVGHTIRLTIEVIPAGVLDIVATSKDVAIGVKAPGIVPPVPPKPPSPIVPPAPDGPPAPPVTPPPVPPVVPPPPIDPSLPDEFGLAAFARSLPAGIPFDRDRKALGLTRFAAAFQKGSEDVGEYFTPTALSVATANDAKARLGADYQAWKPYVVAPLQARWQELNRAGKLLTKEELGRAFADVARGLREGNR